MVNSGNKLIFVLLPGVKAMLKQHCTTDKTFAMIKRALEVSKLANLCCNNIACDYRLNFLYIQFSYTESLTIELSIQNHQLKSLEKYVYTSAPVIQTQF